MNENAILRLLIRLQKGIEKLLRGFYRDDFDPILDLEYQFAIYYRREPTFHNTRNFKWSNYQLLLSFAVPCKVKLDDIYCVMQGDFWSPEGEARELITWRGLRHTSMSVGDLIHNLSLDKLYEVDTVGFKEIDH